MRVTIVEKPRREVRRGESPLRAQESQFGLYEINRRFVDSVQAGEIWEGETFSPHQGLEVFTPRKRVGTLTEMFAQATADIQFMIGRVAAEFEFSSLWLKEAKADISLVPQGHWTEVAEWEQTVWFKVSSALCRKLGQTHPNWSWCNYKGATVGERYWVGQIVFESKVVMTTYAVEKAVSTPEQPEISLPPAYSVRWQKGEFKEDKETGSGFTFGHFHSDDPTEW